MIQFVTLLRDRKLWKEFLAILFLVGFWAYFCRNVFDGFFVQIYRMDIEVDNIGQLWLSWWIEKYFHSPGLSLFHTPFFNAPMGAEVLTYDVAFCSLLIAGLLRPALGMFGSLNGVFVGSLLYSLLATYILIRQVTEDRGFAAALALIPLLFVTRQGAGFVDVDLANFGHGVLALALWTILLTRGGRWRMILTGFFIGLTCVTHMYHGINLMLLLGMGALASLAGREPLDEALGRSWKPTLGAMAIGIALAAPILLPSVESLSFITSRQRLPFFPQQELGFVTNEREYLALLAVIPIFFPAIFLGKRSREIRFWSLVAAVFCLLAAGTHIRMPGTDANLPLPFLLMKNYLPFFWRYNFTDRFGRMGILIMVLALAAILRRIDLQHHLKWFKMAPIQIGLWGAAFCLAPLMIGLAPRGAADIRPIVMDEAIAGHIHRAHALFEDRPRENGGVVLDLFCDDIQSYSMLFQLIHQFPLAGDPLRPDGIHRPTEDSPLTVVKRDLCLAAEKKAYPQLPDKAGLEQENVRFLLLPQVYLKEVDPHFLTDWEQRYGLPAASNDFVRLYDLSDP